MANAATLKLDLGRALNDALDVYKRHFLTFLLAGVLLDLLSICSLFILTGPLCGGMVLMCLRAMSDPKAEPKLGDLFGAFHRFGPLVGLSIITTIPILIGYMLLIVPGVLLSALWLFPMFLMVDQNLTVWDSMRTSARIVMRRGFWINVAAAFLIFALTAGSVMIPYVGMLVSFLIAPLVWLINTSCYIQEVREQYDPNDYASLGFPVIPPFAQQAPQA